MPDRQPATDQRLSEPVGFDLFFRTFGKIGLLSFGGPAGQIALMHRILVDERRWLGERQFLHALNFCMLLPGPEAMQLAAYAGWLMNGVRGGIIAGLLFILPGAAVLIALSLLYAVFGELPLVIGLLFGLKAAVLAIVVQALSKVAKRALSGTGSLLLAIAAFVGLAVFSVPFPLIVLLAMLIGIAVPSQFVKLGMADASPGLAQMPIANRHLLSMTAWTLVLWVLPLVGLVHFLGGDSVYTKEGLFFSKAAIVTFGGAYAVLTYAGQQAVETLNWLQPGEMLTGLGLAETTPGPLILVLVFIGFLAGFRYGNFADPVVGGLLGAIITLWFTFVPCFLWVFGGAPYMEKLSGSPIASGALAAVTAAVVGVIANLSLWFGLHVLFRETTIIDLGPASMAIPVLESFDWRAGMIGLGAGLLIWRGAGLITVLSLCIAVGIAVGTQ
ncbi:MAG: chromate efflux transporter [Rhizobiaceae bacterium]